MARADAVGESVEVHRPEQGRQRPSEQSGHELAEDQNQDKL